MSDNDKQVFDDWVEVADCNLCEHHWNSACDGQADKCTSYLPTNKASILNDIKKLKDDVKSLKFCLIVTYCILLIELIGDLL